MNTGTLPAASIRVRKRTGDLVDFNQQKIHQAVMLCLVNGCRRDNNEATQALANKITHSVERHLARGGHNDVTVEHIQDLVELVLMAQGEHEAARQYILYREDHRKTREAAMAMIDPATLEHLIQDNKRFKTEVAAFQHYDKYARFSESIRRRETYPEAIDRVITFLYNHLDKHKMNVLTPQDWLDIREAMLDEDVSPAMRVMQMAGPALERCNSGAFNCSYVAFDCIEAFTEALYLSMQGCGVGFSVESQYVGQLPMIRKKVGVLTPDISRALGFWINDNTLMWDEAKEHYVLADTTEAWCDSLKLLMYSLYAGYDVRFGLHKLRPAGAKLKTKPGTASGPAPLQELHTFVRKVFADRQGSRLRDIDAHDIGCFIGQVGQLGGVRRAAMISLSDLKSQEMQKAKFGAFWNDPNKKQRTMANNAAVYDEKPDCEVFMQEWVSLAISKSGERGIFNRGSFARQIPPRRKSDGIVFGTNPCFAAGTMVHTREGHFPIEELVGKTVEVWDGDGWRKIDNFRVTGENQPLVEVQMADGSIVRCTPYHKFILSDGTRTKAKDLQAGAVLKYADAPEVHGTIKPKSPYLKGFLLGDGSFSRNNDGKPARPLLQLYSSKYSCEQRLLASAMETTELHVRTGARTEVLAEKAHGQRKMVSGLSARAVELLPWCTTHKTALPAEVFAWTAQAKLELLAGLFDADGTALDTKNGFSYQLCSVYKQLLLDVQLLLKTVGVQAKVTLSKKGGTKDFGDLGGVCSVQPLWRLSIAQTASITFARQVKFDRLTSMADKHCKYATGATVQQRSRTVTSVVSAGMADKVYCCTVPDVHCFAVSSGLLVGQCGEIILRSCGFCNLSIAVVRSDDTLETLKRKVRLATVLGTIQSTLTDYSYIRPIWKKNAEEERLLGVDLLGAMDCPLLRNEGRDEVLDSLKQIVIDTNRELATAMGIPVSAATTTIKPGGNSSVRYTTGQTMAGWLSPFMIRNVEVAKRNAMFQFLVDEGVPWETSYRDKDTAVFSFPYTAPENGFIVSDLVVDASDTVIGVKPRRTALDQLNDWLAFKQHWTEHNPSVSIYVADDEWLAVGDWVQKHWEEIGGLAFFPLDCGVYPQSPMQPVTKKQFDTFMTKFPTRIAWERLPAYDGGEDNTNVRAELACAGGACVL